MTEREIQNAINGFRRELNGAVGQRDLLNIKIMNLQQQIKGLRAALTHTRLENFREQNVGLTEAIRIALRRAGKSLSASEVKTAVAVMGFDLAHFKNPSGAVTNTLQRMFKSGELHFSEESGAYRFNKFYEALLNA